MSTIDCGDWSYEEAVDFMEVCNTGLPDIGECGVWSDEEWNAFYNDEMTDEPSSPKANSEPEQADIGDWSDEEWKAVRECIDEMPDEPSRPKANQMAKCELCGFECAHKNLSRHKGTTRCKKRQRENQFTPKQLKKAKQAKWQARLEKQKAQVTCSVCCALVTKRHLKRHQKSSACQKPKY